MGDDCGDDFDDDECVSSPERYWYLLPRGSIRGDESRRRRDRDVDIPWETSRGGAATATWIYPWETSRGGAATATWIYP